MSQSLLYSGNTPVTFLSWLESQKNVSSDFKENFNRYQRYITDWIAKKNIKEVESEDYFYSIYIDLLKEISLNFLTEEERRFIVNFDYTIEDNLDIVLPFFIEKLKNICLYYSEQREKLKEKITLIPYKGTNLFTSKFVKNLIIENYNTGFIQKQNEGKVSFPSLSAITKSLDIHIEEVYDDTNYYNKPNTPEDGLDYFKNFGKIDVDKDLYLNFKGAIISAIKKYPLFIKSFVGAFSINYTLSGNEYSYLKERDFISYFNSLSSTDLKLNLQKQLFPKYVSTDFFYLSVGKNPTTPVSGILFSSKNYTNKTLNLTNREQSTIATVPSLENLYTAYEMGRFFTPARAGVLQYSGFKKGIEIDYSKLKPDTVYIFPDPYVVETGNSPLTYKLDVSWVKEDIGSSFKFGDVLIDKHYQRFYSYQSYSQDVMYQPHGLSLAVDNIDFWNGPMDSTWTESDIWPGTDVVERLPIDTRFNSLLFNKGTCVNWFTDIFGNEFGLYKDTKDTTNIYDKKRLLPGDLYIKNTVTGVVSSSNHFLKTLYKKYPEHIFNELNDKIYSFYLNRTLLVVETKNFICIDSYNFDLGSGEFLINLLPGIYIPKFEINEYLEKYIGSYYIDKTEELYLCFLKLLPSLSASNYKSLYPVIYRIKLEDLNVQQVYPLSRLDATVYSLSSSRFKNFPEISLKYIEGGKFSYKEKFNLFNFTYYAYNENNIPFIVNEQFSIENNNSIFTSYEPLLHKPYYYVHDTNFANPGVDVTLRFGSTYSEVAGYKKAENFRWSMDEENYDNYYFCSKISPVFINFPGLHYIQYDWTQYLYGNMFVGCENMQASFIDNKNFVTFRNEVIELTKEETWYRIGDVYKDGSVYTLSAYLPYNSNGSIVGFSITNSQPTTGVVFCEDLFSVYRTINLFVAGSGSGLIYSDPFCIECEKTGIEPVKCSFQYPLFNTIVFKASAYTNSLFNGWKGGPCDGTVGNCFYTTSETNNVTAVFTKVPRYTLKVTANIPEVSTLIYDGASPSGILCFNSVCSADYVENTLVAVSAGPAPKGFTFDSFKGIDLEGNNPAIFNMSKNYSLTAMYVSASNNIDIYNYFNVGGEDERKFGFIYGSISTYPNNDEPIAIILSPNDYVLGYGDGVKNTGTLICSLCPDVDITGFAMLEAQRDTFVSIIPSGSEDGRYKFDYYKGSPCNNNRGICSFNLSFNYSISAFFNYPYYNIQVFNLGDELFYTESSDGNLNAGTITLESVRNKTSYNYVSGTVISLSSFTVQPIGTDPLSGMRYIRTGTKDVESPNEVYGSEYLVLEDYIITESKVITAYCERDQAKLDFTLARKGVPSLPESTLRSINLFAQVVDGINSYTSENVIQETVNVFQPFVPILLKPVYYNPNIKYQYVEGRDIYIDLAPQLPLVITNSTNLLNGVDVSTNSPLVTFKGDLKTPIFIDTCDALLSWNNEIIYYASLFRATSATFVFSPVCELGNYNTTLIIERLDVKTGRNPTIPCPRANSWCEPNQVGLFRTSVGTFTESYTNISNENNSGIDIFAWFDQNIVTEITGGVLNEDYTITDYVIENGNQKQRQIRYIKFGNYTVRVSVINI